MKILDIVKTGVIGVHVSKLLLNEGYEVVGFDNSITTKMSCQKHTF